MSDCFFHSSGPDGYTCHGWDPECRFNEEQVKGGYKPYPYNDSHRRNPGLHEAIYEVLLKRLQLKQKDVTRLCTFYHGPSNYRSGEDNYYFQVLVEIQKDAFFMGVLERSCEGNINFPTYYKGWFWIGRTRYQIWEAIR
jgi:hypothetical protein